jgi:hypothetical protein
MRSLLALPCFVLATACATLDPAELGRCGNGIIESGETCDAPNTPEGQFGPGLSCGKPGLPNECRLLAKEGFACPAGSHRGEDGVCRGPTGYFVRLGGLDAAVLQLVEREQEPHVLVRRGDDLEVLSLSRAGAATPVADGANLASGLRAQGESPDDLRPSQDGVQPLLPSGNLLIPLETRGLGGTGANSIGLFPSSGSGFVAAVQTSVPAVAGNDPIALPFTKALVATPMEAGTSLAEPRYLSLAGSSLELCGVGSCFTLAEAVAVPRVAASDFFAYTTADFEASILTALGVGVESPEGDRARGIVVDAPAEGSSALRFSTYGLEAVVSVCGDAPVTPDEVLEDALVCTVDCLVESNVEGCNCAFPLQPPCEACNVCVDVEVFADRVFATAAQPSTSGAGVDLGFAALFQVPNGTADQASFLGFFVATHEGPGPCLDPSTCDPSGVTLDDAFLNTPDLVAALDGVESIGVEQDVTGDGVADPIVDLDSTPRTASWRRPQTVASSCGTGTWRT